MIEAIINGENNPAALADLAQRRLREKIPELKHALRGGVGDHHRFMLKTLFEHLKYLEGVIAGIEQRIDFHLRSESLNQTQKEDGALPFDEAVTLLATIPGIDTCVAQAVVAEIGTNMKQFPTRAIWLPGPVCAPEITKAPVSAGAAERLMETVGLNGSSPRPRGLRAIPRTPTLRSTTAESRGTVVKSEPWWRSHTRCLLSFTPCSIRRLTTKTSDLARIFHRVRDLSPGRSQKGVV